MNRLHQKPGPRATLLLWLWFAALIIAAGALAPSLDQIMGW